ncbi:MAG: hypothetical protein EP343_09155 [Deltaproteobacteria bacterium]|nr:MAG: hypothetical protein EP343_09155 [Deltaproteobacteria bacterium]
MRNRIRQMFGITCLLMGFAIVGSWVGCGTEEKPECTDNTDCISTGADAICYQQKCRARAKEGEECNELDGLICQKQNDRTPSQPLICTSGVCKVKCTTNFDCKTRDGETCDTNSGVCVKPTGNDGGTETVPEDTGGKGESEECSDTVKCQTGLDCVKRSSAVNEGKCWKPCTKQDECASGQICTGTHCVPANDTCEIQGGTEVTPCWSGLTCVLEGAASGTCYKSCTDTAECPADYECATKGTGKVCLPKSDRAGAGQPCGDIGGKTVGCIDGYQCAKERQDATQTTCLKKCAQDTDCDWPSFCLGGICTLGNAGTAKLGAACSTKNDATEDKRCEGGHYCLVLKQGSNDGFCYRSCKDPRKTDCPTDLTCIAVNTEQLCLKKCSKPEDCTSNTPATSCQQFQGSTDQVCLHPAN